MSELTQNIKGVVPVLQCNNVEQSIDYFETSLDFSCVFRWGEPVGYAILTCNKQSLHLCQNENKRPSAIYIFCQNIDKLHAELKKKGAKLAGDVESMIWGMREFEVRDLDGNVIIFGEEIDESEE